MIGTLLNAVLGAIFDETVAVGHIHQHVAPTVEETNDLERLENQATPLVENALAVLDVADDLDWTYLTARDAGVAWCPRSRQGTLHSSRLRSGEMAGDALNLRIIEAADHNLVIRPEQPEFRIDRTCGAALGSADNPNAEQHHDQQQSAAEDKPKPPHVATVLNGSTPILRPHTTEISSIIADAR